MGLGGTRIYFSFNRTRLELKQNKRLFCPDCGYMTFNRTRLELKRYCLRTVLLGSVTAFNRTRLELKQAFRLLPIQLIQPLIEPGWN